MRRRSFYRREHEVKVSAEATQATSVSSAEESTAQVRSAGPLRGVCRKCGRFIGRGLYFHEKYCKHDLSSPGVDS